VQNEIAITADFHAETFVSAPNGMNFVADKARFIGKTPDAQDGRVFCLSVRIIAFLTNLPNRKWC
jgi:hypothetical protein